MARQVAAAALVALSSACAGGGLAPPPEPVTPPTDPGLAVPSLDEAAAVPVLTPPPAWGGGFDPILDSRWAWTPEMREAVDEWVGVWTGRGRGWFAGWLENMGAYEGLVDREIEARGLPRSLRYLPILESGYRPTAVSRARAVGLWQFMRGTALLRGMEVTPLWDERRDPEIATPNALGYLSELEERFGSWFLALAAYNGGPGRMERLLERHAPGVPGSDSLYWALRPRLPSDTRHFVPQFLAAARIASDPRRYGFTEIEPREPLAYETVVVPEPTSVDVLARAAEAPMEEIEALNPQLVRGLTPDKGVPIRVPPGKAEVFARNYAEIPPDERVTFIEHRVRRGETLSHIAVAYGVRVTDIQAANPGVRPRYVQIGQRLIVPRAPSAVAALSPRRYTVQPGDTLSAIAARHGVRATALARANGLDLDAVIRPGDRMEIPAATPGR